MRNSIAREIVREARRKPPRERWCVKHATGWCATKTGRPPREDATSVPTRCGYFVVLPGGTRKMIPTCAECQK